MNNKKNYKVYKKCPYDLTEITIERNNDRFEVSLPLLSNIHYKTSFEEFDELFQYIIKHLDYLEESAMDHDNNTRSIL